MFSIIISEKGGAERRESFDKTEINVGRVQGNDLMLPKGNVSKRHARLLYRDGRFIVTDLKSTNGTYVNGRKIAQATIVREGDKIYIGDFVLRIELAGEARAPSDVGAPLDGAAPAHDEAPPMAADEAAAAAAGGASGAPPQPGFNRPSGQMPPPLPGAPTAGPPPMAQMMSPSIPQAPGAPRPDSSGSINVTMGSPAAGVAIAGGAPPAMIAGVPAQAAPPRETVLGPGPRVLSPPAMVQAQQPSAPPPQPVPPQQPVPPTPPSPPQGTPPASPAISPAISPASGSTPAFALDGAPVPPAPPQPVPPGFVPHGLTGAAAPHPAQVPPALDPGGYAPPPAPAFGGPHASPAFGTPAVNAPPPLAAQGLGAQGLAHPPIVSPPAPVPSAPPPASGMPSPAVAPVASQIPAPPAKVSAPPPASIPASSQPSQAGVSGAPRSSVRSAAASEGVVDSSQAALHREALAKLMDRATSSVDMAALAGGDAPSSSVSASIERVLAEKAAQMRASGELPAGIDADTLVGEARRELFDLGPIGPLLEDEYVEEVQLIRHDHVVAMHGKKQVATEIAFTSEAAVARVVRRICVRSGRPLADGEVFVERRLEHGARLFGVLPPASGDGHMLVLRKPQRALATLEDLVKSGTIARQMATLVAQAVQGRANILVTGSVGAGATILLGALAAAGNLEDRVVVLQEDDELVLNQPHTVSMLIGDTAHEGARAVHAAIRVRPDRLVVGAFAGHVVAEIVDAIGDGVDGVLAAARAPTLRHLVARLPADIAATRSMLSADTAREWLAGSFDLVLEVARLRDGRNRVMRVSEFALTSPNPLELRDIFTFTVERTAAGGTVEGSFHPTGVVPRIAEDLVSRGVPLDLGIFKRTTR
ncbi:MAG: Flp pilus assembly complex ATPase component TadA [Polyangiaceae bacterium]|nr:Flp pilus assembly complex ATPase component TadA [Polyangiaceae bacterium]